MSQLSDIEVLKDIPGYKAIMKSVLKSQIQLLLEQLSDNTGEESIILTASVHDGTLSHLGSSTGKGFLEGRDEIKSQFLGYCLKTHHKQKTQETKTPYQRSHPGPRTPTQHQQQPPMKRPRPSPISLSRVSPGRPPPRPQPKPPSYSYNTHPGTGGMPLSSDDQNISESHADGDVIVKQEISDNPDNISHHSAHTNTSIGMPASTSAAPISFPSSLQLSHTQTSSDQANAEQTEGAHEQSDNVNLDSSSIKIEPITEGEMDLEITGVEVADNSMSSEAWGQQGQIGYGMDGDGSFSHGDGDPSGYRHTYQIKRPKTAFTRHAYQEIRPKNTSPVLIPSPTAPVLAQSVKDHTEVVDKSYTEKVFGWKTEQKHSLSDVLRGTGKLAGTFNEHAVGTMNTPSETQHDHYRYEDNSDVPYIITVENVEGVFTEINPYNPYTADLHDSRNRTCDNTVDENSGMVLRYDSREKYKHPWRQLSRSHVNLNSDLQEKLRNKIKERKQDNKDKIR